MYKETADAWNDTVSYPTREDVAAALDISDRTLRERLAKLRKQGVHLVNRHWVNSSRTGYTGHTATGPMAGKPHKIDEIHVITAVQSNTNPHPAFQTLLNYCRSRGAKLHCIPHRYVTRTVFEQKDETYASAFIPHLLAEPDSDGKLVGKDLEIANGHGVIMGSAKIQATAVNPTNRFESIGGNKWVFLGHPQVQMRVIPTAQDTLPKIVVSSGSMSVPEYREGTAGKAGEFHHVIGATVIEVCGDYMHVRQLNADDKGVIYDIHGKYSPRKVEPLDGIEALVTGDEHEMFYSPHVKQHTYMPGGIVQTLQPKRIVRHDVLDFWSANHHHVNDPITQFIKHHSGTNSVERELDQCVLFLDETTPDADWFVENVIVASNHPEALTKWLKTARIERDPENAYIFHKLWLGLLESARMTNKGADYLDPFEAYVRERATKKHHFTDRDKQFLIAGIDVSQHGDFGPNGARGSVSVFAKAANKMVIAHSHTPGINKGVYQVGHSTDGLSYAKGHSSWFNTHCAIYPNGKRTLIHILPIGWYGSES